MSTVLAFLNTMAAAIILTHGLFHVINAMGHGTRHGMRCAWIVLTTGALGVLLAPLFDKPVPSPYWTGILVGIALYILFDRRRDSTRRIFG